MPSTTHDILSIRDLRVVVPGRARPILDLPSLDVERGSFTCWIGPNGSGKSTLMRCLMRLIPYEGQILVDGKPVERYARKALAQKVSYLPQVHPLPAISVFRLIAHGRYPHLGFSKTLREEDREIIARAARQTGVEHLLEKNVALLSGGERQRVYLAMLIAQDTEILLLDEPTTYLDIRYQLDVLRILQRLHEAGKTIIMVAHDLTQAFTIASHLAILYDGKLLATGKPEEIYRQPRIAEVFHVGLAPVHSKEAIYRYHYVKRDDEKKGSESIEEVP